MSYIMDTIFGDGSEGSGTPDALKTVGGIVNGFIAVGAIEAVSNSLSGGINTGGGPAAAPAATASISFTGPSA